MERCQGGGSLWTVRPNLFRLQLGPPATRLTPAETQTIEMGEQGAKIIMGLHSGRRAFLLLRTSSVLAKPQPAEGGGISNAQEGET